MADAKKKRKKRDTAIPMRGPYHSGYWVTPYWGSGYGTAQGCISGQQFGGYADPAVGSDSSTGAV